MSTKGDLFTTVVCALCLWLSTARFGWPWSTLFRKDRSHEQREAGREITTSSAWESWKAAGDPWQAAGHPAGAAAIAAPPAHPGRVMAAPLWTERWPGRLECELEALRAAGISFEIDPHAWDAGVLRLHVQLGVNGGSVAASATFPDHYPEFRFVVEAPPLGVTHHQSPMGGEVCLFGRRGHHWDPGTTLASALTQQYPKVLASGHPDAETYAIDEEDPQAEPITAYYETAPGCGMLVDGSWVIPEEVSSGTLLLAARPVDIEQGRVFGAVLEVRNAAGEVLAKADDALAALFSCPFEGRWIRAHEPLPDVKQSRESFELTDSMLPPRLRNPWPRQQFGPNGVRILGLLMPMETGHRRRGHGWLFGARIERPTGNRQGRRKGQVQHAHVYVGAAYAGRDDLGLRIPSLQPLRSKAIVVFGLGTLGAPATLEFARAGVGELRVVDGDVVDVGPTVRWPFGLQVVGLPKAMVIAQFIRDNYPFTRAMPTVRRIGRVRGDEEPHESELLDSLLTKVSLVFDASAEYDLQRALAMRAKEAGIPYVGVTARHGGWGGVVFRHLPGTTRGCWNCLQWALSDGAIADAPAEETSAVQDQGCGDVTFTGASFDMTAIALHAVRKAVGTLVGRSGGYPDSDWDVCVIGVRESDGSILAPSCQTYRLDRHPACSCGDQS
jgi:molybdopterin/thiamine biosynthesis adenylyltransferase